MYTTTMFVIVLLYQCSQVLSLATDVRLSHGSNIDGEEFRSYEGAIEVLVDGQWGPISRHGVDSVTAKTICKLLGHGLTGFVVERFSFTGFPVLDSLSCLGNETSITQCTQVQVTPSGQRFDVPGVHCFAQVFNEVRLIDGEGPNNGTVNIKMDGRWGLLCGYPTGNRFPTPDVDLAICRTLGYQETLDRAPRFGQYVDVYIGWLDVDKIHCDGDETNLNQCTVSKGTLHHQPRCSNIRGVNCVTRLDQFCTSDEICAAVDNAVCVDNICRCKLGHFQTDLYKCTVLSLATDVRLSHGSNTDGVEFRSYEGAIEVLVDGQWGPISRHGVDSVTAKTICKVLGHGLTGFVVERFSFTGIPVLDSLSCLGNETSITQCTKVRLSTIGQRYDAPGVHCFAQVFNEVRLIDGEGPNNGTVNIKMDGRWGLLCGYPTGNTFSTPEVDLAICRTLGYQETLDRAPRFGQYVDVYIGWLDVDKIHCDGDETNLNQCTVSKGTLHHQPRCSNIRGVNCVTRLDQFCTSDEICAAVDNAVCVDNICRCKLGHFQTDLYKCTVLSLATDVRLSHGSNTDGVEFRSYEGAIEVLVDGQWGPISRHGVDSVTAKTICKVLGHGLTGFVVERFSFTGIPVLDSLSCLGNETAITQCTKVRLSTIGQRYDAPGVHCFAQVFNEVRLIDGEGPNNGTVNIKMDGRWGLLCGYPTGNTFSTPEVDLAICRTLGYQETLDRAPRFGQYVDVYIGWLDVDKIHCDGDETNLNQCTVSKGTLHHQPRCSNIRGVNCVTRLDQFCTSDEICAAVDNAVCVDNICRCKLGHFQTDLYKCTGLSLATDVRLSHGSNIDGVEFSSYEGAIEVLVDGQWGPIIRHGVDSVTAKTICKLLGHGLTGFVVERFSFTGIPVLDSLSCLGNETSITQCTQVRLSTSGQRYDAPGVHCFAQVFNEVRLIDGEGPNNGTVNIKMDGRWGLLCGYPTGNTFPTPEVDLAICRTLGYQETLDRAPRFGQYVDVYIGWLDVDKIHCDGDETNLNQCTVSKGTLHRQPRCSNIRGVNCVTRLDQFCTSDEICAAVDNAVCVDNICRCKLGHFQTDPYKCTDKWINDVRLTGGQTSYDGALEVKFGERWGPVCAFNMSERTENIICQSLWNAGRVGYRNTITTSNQTLPWIDHFTCEVTHTDLNQCYYILASYSACDPATGPQSVTCLPVRLIDGPSKHSGRIEVGFDGRQYTICAEQMNLAIANVICKVLGYSMAFDVFIASEFGKGTLDIFQETIECNGNETSLDQCYISNTMGEFCASGNVGGVGCLECDAIHFGQNCTEVCDCEMKNVELTSTNRICDIVTGYCICKSDWTGSRCDNVSTSGTTDTQDTEKLIIIVSSATAGCLLVVVIVIVCVCKYRNRPPNASSSPSKQSSIELKARNGSKNDQTTSMKPYEVTEYNTIDDHTVAADVNADSDYDLHLDLQKRTDNESINKGDGYNSAGYLKSRQININPNVDYDYADGPVKTDNAGYLTFGDGKQLSPQEDGHLKTDWKKKVYIM